MKNPISNVHKNNENHKNMVSICNSYFHPEFNGIPCACMNCNTIGFCIIDPCSVCDGPTDVRCNPPDDSVKEIQS